MTLLISAARAEHAAQIAAIKALVWPAERADAGQVVRGLGQPGHVAYVAIDQDDRVAGFVDGFPTVGADGLRWEVDLLAVHPAYQGQKIGQRLVAASTEAGVWAGAALARALVHIENVACQVALRRCGYVTSGTIYRLMVSSADVVSDSPLPGETLLIPVETMNYSGLWLEGRLSAASLRAGQAERTRRGCDLVGALIPAANADLLAAAESLGYRPVDCFQWWTCRLR